MAAIYSNGGNRWNILGFNFTKRDALSSHSSVYKISMEQQCFHCFIRYKDTRRGRVSLGLIKHALRMF